MCAVAMIKSFLILAFECLVFDAAKKEKKSPSHTDIIKEQRDCLSSWMRRMRRGGGGEHVDELGRGVVAGEGGGVKQSIHTRHNIADLYHALLSFFCCTFGLLTALLHY